ncbi:MAG: tetratricopeptide repeat protein [Patescibacteria group bacterium]
MNIETKTNIDNHSEAVKMLKKENYKEAEKLIERALHYNPDDPWIMNDMASIYLKRSRYEEAKKLQGSAEKMMPDNPYVKIGMGDILARMGQYDQAKQYYDAARELNHNLSELQFLDEQSNHYKDQGTKYLKEGKLQKALDDLDKTLVIDPNMMWAEYDKGHAFMQLGDTKNALKSAQRCKNLEPNNTWVRTFLGKALIMNGKMTEAREELEAAMNIDANNKEAKDLFGSLIEEKNNSDSTFNLVEHKSMSSGRASREDLNEGPIFPFSYEVEEINRDFKKTFEILGRENCEWDDVSFELPKLKVLLGSEKFSAININEKIFYSFEDTLGWRKEGEPGNYLYSLASLKQVFPDKFSKSKLIRKSIEDLDWQRYKRDIEDWKRREKYDFLVGDLRDLKTVSEDKFKEYASVITDKDWVEIIKTLHGFKKTAEDYDRYIERNDQLRNMGYNVLPTDHGKWHLLANYCANLITVFPDKFDPADYLNRSDWSKMAKQYGLEYNYEVEKFYHENHAASLILARDMKIISDVQR